MKCIVLVMTLSILIFVRQFYPLVASSCLDYVTIHLIDKTLSNAKYKQ